MLISSKIPATLRHRKVENVGLEAFTLAPLPCGPGENICKLTFPGEYIMNIIKSLAVTTSLAFLTACNGGSGSDPTPVSATTAVGLWNGSTDSSRSLTGIVLSNGTYWVLYSAPNNSAAIAGIVLGKGASDNGKFSSSTGIDFNLEGQGIHNATVSANYVAKQSFNGSITYPTLNMTATFTSSYNTAFDQPLSLSNVAGTYSGSAYLVGTLETATLVVTSAGVVSGSGVSGCQFSGVATPLTNGNLFDLSITFGGGVCSNGTNTDTGIVYFDANAKKLYAVAVNENLSNGFVFAGTMP